ncbi:MAG: hypothetical protein M0Z59_03115 [Nitrospiraceae bacterium]|nr:hypothetical protein [Nitrospiraceae bacterium]
MIGQTSGIEKAARCAAPVATAYTIAAFGADDDTLAIAQAGTGALVGVFQHTTSTAGETVRVMLTGISRVVLGGAVTRGDSVTSGASGMGVAATRHAHTENTAAAYTQNAATQAAPAVNTLGVALASGAAGDIIPVLLSQGMV